MDYTALFLVFFGASLLGYFVGSFGAGRQARFVHGRLLRTIEDMLEKEQYRAATRMVRYARWRHDRQEPVAGRRKERKERKELKERRAAKAKAKVKAKDRHGGSRGAL